MKRLVCFAVLLVLGLSLAMTALAYDSGVISYSKSAPFFEYDGSTYVSIHYWTVANVQHTFRAYSTSDDSAFTGAQTTGTTVAVAPKGKSSVINSMPGFSASISSGGTSITCTYSGGSYTVYYYANFYYADDGTMITMTNELHNTSTSFNGSKTLTK